VQRCFSMDATAVRARVQELVGSGVLPNPLPAKVWVGPSEGHVCFICQEPIASGHMECEVELASTVIARLHRGCFDALVAAMSGRATGPMQA
jgi:hypothetical protein